jgi:hypothetical protein
MYEFGKAIRGIKEAPFFNELYRIYTEYKTARFYKKRELEDIFTEINLGNKWAGQESSSGIGSDLLQTKTIIREIPILLRELGVSTFLDLPCGDHNWMQKADLSGVQYIGGDIVENLIERNNKVFGNHQKIFTKIDLSKDPLPNADLILVRDCLVHLNYDTINLIINNLKKSSIKYILTTTFPITKRNYDITTGNWRPLNLNKNPFYFPPPRRIIVETCTESYGQYTDKSLGLWEIQSLPSTLQL